MHDILIQAIGYIGVLLFIFSYQIKSNRALFFCQILGSALFCLQFFLLNALSGCLNLMVIMFRNGLLMWYDKYSWVRWKGWIVILSAVCTVILVFTWKGTISLLPFAALIASNVGYWTNNAQKIRLSNLACASPCWLLYDILVGSWGGVLNESITLGSIVLSIYRYGWRAMGDPNSEFQKR